MREGKEAACSSKAKVRGHVRSEHRGRGHRLQGLMGDLAENAAFRAKSFGFGVSGRLGVLDVGFRGLRLGMAGAWSRL